MLVHDTLKNLQISTIIVYEGVQFMVHLAFGYLNADILLCTFKPIYVRWERVKWLYDGLNLYKSDSSEVSALSHAWMKN